MIQDNDATIDESIRKNIEEFRKNNFPGYGGLKQCAEKFGVSPQMWSNWEGGRNTPTEENQRKLADFMGITVRELRGEWSPLTRDAMLNAARTAYKDKFGSDASQNLLDTLQGVMVHLINGNDSGELTEDELIENLHKGRLITSKEKRDPGHNDAERTEALNAMMEAANTIHRTLQDLLVDAITDKKPISKVAPIFHRILDDLIKQTNELDIEITKTGG